MSTDGATPPLEAGSGSPITSSFAPFPPPNASARILADDHIPAIPSPLNPDFRAQKTPAPDETASVSAVGGREKRTKKETLKKRESKAPAAASTEVVRPTADSRPKVAKNVPLAETSPMRYKLPPPKLGDFEEFRGPTFIRHHEVDGPEDGKIEFNETTDHVYNKKGFYYTPCIADPGFPSSFFYRQTEPIPHGARMGFEDSATHIMFDTTAKHITTDKGWRLARANVAVRQGRWYWECKITRGILRDQPAPGSDQPPSNGHVRVGWARREASLDAPTGFDAYSYGIRDKDGQSVHMSRPKDFFPPGEEIREGDVIGLEINLPSEQLHRKVVGGDYNPAVDLLEEEDPSITNAVEAANIVRDRLPIRFKHHIYFETPDYHTTPELEDLMNPSPMSASGAGTGQSEGPNPNHKIPCLRTLPNSWIRIYKNGKLIGTPFTNLLAFLPLASKPATAKQADSREGLDDGMLGYYPAVSVFRGGAAQVNFGPDLWCPPPELLGVAAIPQAKSTQETDQDGDTDMGTAENPVSAVVAAEIGGPQPGRNPCPLRPLTERYDEQVAEDIVYDIIDEVDFWIKDGGKVLDRTGRGEQVVFKEVVQDM